MNVAQVYRTDNLLLIDLVEIICTKPEIRISNDSKNISCRFESYLLEFKESKSFLRLVVEYSSR